MTIWLFSDPHFDHENILKFKTAEGDLIRPGFSSVKEMNEAIVENINKAVKPSDHLYCLGDIAMARSGLAWMKRLNGKKRLILGNHDIFTIPTYAKEAGIQKFFGSRKLGAALLTHIPVHGDSIPRWAVGNIHGHIHERESPPGPYLNVSVERTNFSPITLEEAIEALKHRRLLINNALAGSKE